MYLWFFLSFYFKHSFQWSFVKSNFVSLLSFPQKLIDGKVSFQVLTLLAFHVVRLQGIDHIPLGLALKASTNLLLNNY